MDIIIFSDTNNIEKCFSCIKKKGEYNIQYFSCKDFKKSLTAINNNSFIYYDISGCNENEKNKILKSLAKIDKHNYGIIDAKGSIQDIAELFHNRASDYIGKDLYKIGISEKRLKRIIEFRTIEHAEESICSTASKNYIISGNDWKNIKTGQEYTFCFLFFELDNQKELRKSFSATQLDEFRKIIHDYMENVVSPINGKIWMWMDFGGLVLLPFDGVKCDAIATCFKLIMDRTLISVEQIKYNIHLSYKIILHIGNTIYKSRGNTGTIVSDSINSIFHLAHKYAEPGNLYITNDIVEFVPKNLEKYFLPAGEFEGRKIIRMKHLS